MKNKVVEIGKECETAKVSTVNVMELSEYNVSLTSFRDDEVGNREANMLFHKLVKENYPETLDEEIEEYLDDGLFEKNGYKIFVVHSE